jgi:ABC-2 type transport system ATP-binding protein
MALMVEFKNVRKNYGSKTAVEDLNLTVETGELFVLLGPNGAGKTTTLKMLSGLLKPTAGKILISGIDPQVDAVAVKRRMSFVPDVPFVYEKLTPWELLHFVGRLHGLSAETIESRGAELLDFFSLDDVEDVLIQEFSHGMRQKAVLSAALLHRPSLLVLDEPMVGLDPAGIKQFKDFLKQKAAEGLCVILSTHLLAMAEELAQRIGIIHEGRLIACGSLADLRQRYRSRENLENMFMQLTHAGKA